MPPGTTHGDPWPYDTHVPLVLAGWQIRPRRITADVQIADVAPTLASLLGLKIREAEGIDGRPLRELSAHFRLSRIQVMHNIESARERAGPFKYFSKRVVFLSHICLLIRGLASFDFANLPAWEETQGPSTSLGRTEEFLDDGALGRVVCPDSLRAVKKRRIKIIEEVAAASNP